MQELDVAGRGQTAKTAQVTQVVMIMVVPVTAAARHMRAPPNTKISQPGGGVKGGNAKVQRTA
jgi:hypothetical protein